MKVDREMCAIKGKGRGGRASAVEGDIVKVTHFLG